jgi:hypothetical protein
MRIRSTRLFSARRSRAICAALASCALLSCERDPTAGAAAKVTQEAPRAIECRVDDDCTLTPAVMTCCEECEPMPPFEAVPRTAVDAMLIELETRCAAKPPICEPRSCEEPPAGCQATAICVEGRCALVQTDACGRGSPAPTGAPRRRRRPGRGPRHPPGHRDDRSPLRRRLAGEPR